MSETARTIDVAAFIERCSITPYNRLLILLSLLATAFEGFDQMSISYTAPYMVAPLHLSKVMLGNVFSAGSFGMMSGGLVLSFLGDRVGRRSVVVTAVAAFGLLTVATAFVPNYPDLLILRFLCGLAMGGALPVIWALNIEYAPARLRATVVTVVTVGYSIGTSVAGPVTNALAPRLGWASVFEVGGCASLACAGVLALFLPESIRFLSAKGRRPDVIARTLRRLSPETVAGPTDRFIVADERLTRIEFDPSLLFEARLKWVTTFLWIGFALSAAGIYLIANWGPSLLEALDFSRAVSADGIALATILGAVGGLLLMRFTDRFGPFALAVYPLLAVPVLLVVGLAKPVSTMMLPLLVLGSSLISASHFGIISICGVFYPSVIRANGAGWAASVSKLGGVLAPIVGGYLLSSHMAPAHIFALLAICPFGFALCIIGMGLALADDRRR